MSLHGSTMLKAEETLKWGEDSFPKTNITSTSRISPQVLEFWIDTTLGLWKPY